MGRVELIPYSDPGLVLAKKLLIFKITYCLRIFLALQKWTQLQFKNCQLRVLYLYHSSCPIIIII